MGWLHARDRAFQIDCARRSAGGRLSELFGKTSFDKDRLQRQLGTTRTATSAVESLPPNQRELLRFYKAGVNDQLASRRVPSFWHAASGLWRMDPWNETDTLLVLIALYQALSFDVSGRLTEQGLRHALPEAVASFLMPSCSTEDDYPVPPEVLCWLREQPYLARHASLEAFEPLPSQALGSNCWTVSGDLTASGEPTLACDTHLAPGLPCPWHRVEVEMGQRRLAGAAIPGIPMVLLGSNGSLAWGLTNLPGDTLDIVPSQEAGPPIKVETDTIHVRGRGPENVHYIATQEGPLLALEEGTEPVVVRWSGLWPSALDLGLERLAWCDTLDQALEVARESGGPPVYLHLAHRVEGIAMTLTGRRPLRRQDKLVRDCYERGAENPVERGASGRILFSANDAKPKGSPFYGRGWNHPSSSRALRVEGILRGRKGWREREFLTLQSDLHATHLDAYRELAQEGLRGPASDVWPEGLRARAAKAIESWDGELREDSLGAPLLEEYASRISSTVLEPFLVACRERQPAFSYSWRNKEPMVRSLLSLQDPSLWGWPAGTPWSVFLDHLLGKAAIELERLRAQPLEKLTWSQGRKRRLTHAAPGAFFWGAIGKLPLPACGDEDCVFAMGDGAIPAQRLVITPGAEERGLFSMTGGQSENPFSRHSRDHHRIWMSGEAMPLLGLRVK